jgi:hypothetical protein
MMPTVFRKFDNGLIHLYTHENAGCTIHYEWRIIAGNVREELILIPRYRLIIRRETEKGTRTAATYMAFGADRVLLVSASCLVGRCTDWQRTRKTRVKSGRSGGQVVA